MSRVPVYILVSTFTGTASPWLTYLWWKRKFKFSLCGYVTVTFLLSGVTLIFPLSGYVNLSSKWIRYVGPLLEWIRYVSKSGPKLLKQQSNLPPSVQRASL